MTIMNGSIWLFAYIKTERKIERKTKRINKNNKKNK